MIGKAILPWALLAPAAPALAQPAPLEAYHIRNETSRSFSCGLRREPERRIHRFFLRQGADYRHETAGGTTRTLLCDTQHATQRYRLSAGGQYALVEHQGYVTLRRLPDAPATR